MQALIIIGVIAFIGGIVFLAIYFSRAARVKRALKNTPWKRIPEFIPGEKGKIIGKVIYAGQTVQSPLSGRRCAAYHITVEEYRRSGRSSSWVQIISEEQCGDVVINDGSGIAYIEKQGMYTHYVQDGKFSSGTFNDAAPHLEAFLQRHGRSSTGLLGFNKQLRYKEGILEENETVAVVGIGNWGSARQKNLNINGDRILLIAADEKGKVYLSDDPGVCVVN